MAALAQLPMSGSAATGGLAAACNIRGRAPSFDRAFERFSRADPGRAGRGAGLGLPIVRMIARAHGGDAHAANREEGGADVWLVIPESPGG